MKSWTQSNHILCTTINGNEYEVYETEPGMQRLRRNGRLIAETFTIEEAQRWAESYDKWLEQEAPKLPKKQEFLPPFTDMSNAFEMGMLKRFPRYPGAFGEAPTV